MLFWKEMVGVGWCCDRLKVGGIVYLSEAWLESARMPLGQACRIDRIAPLE